MRGSRVLAAVLAGFLLVPALAQACSCAPQPPADSLRESDAAIVGRLVKVLPRGRLHADYRYEVLHVYRGRKSIEPGQFLDVRSARRAAACALPRRLGHRYGLFLLHRYGHWSGGICGVISPRRLRRAAGQQSEEGSARASMQPVLCG
jgi:hypothetical protein